MAEIQEKSTRVAVFIDNSNVIHRLNDLKKIDQKWTKLYDPQFLAEKLAGNRTLAGVYFYCAPPPPYLLTEGVQSQEKYKMQMRYFEAVKKQPKVELKYASLKGPKGNMCEKNLDTQLTTDMITKAALSEFDVAILVANDGDYVSVVEQVKSSFGKRVELLFFKDGLSMDLWKVCDIARRARQIQFKGIKLDP